ncbi:G-protein coupled receptor 157 isoform X2 [Cervus canadensis]|uniref:G-protein coupled receptor 157 isoform X2 n=1 Tax=Cervus canadensis TaxID=1574408 RepID=UPI001C9E1F05|nr:G-protein coupled receptor 157 isoform X2 [Cervus canadensis]
MEPRSYQFYLPMPALGPASCEACQITMATGTGSKPPKDGQPRQQWLFQVLDHQAYPMASSKPGITQQQARPCVSPEPAKPAWGQSLPSCHWYLLADTECWGVPLAITVAAVALKKIGYDASDVSVGWCWINLEAEDRVLWMLLTGKLWELLAYVTLPVLYLLIRKHIHRAREELSEYRPIVSEVHRLQRHTSVADKKLVLIPLIFICLRVWSTVRFVLTLCGSPAVRMPVLVVLHGIGNTFQGGANCIMFVFCTRAVRTRLLSLCCCCTPQPPAAESLAGPPKAPVPSKSESQRPRRTPNELPST